MTDAPICHAHKADTGEPCKAFAIRGGTVCVYHGGSVPSVRQKALERMQALVDPAITRIHELIMQDEDRSVSMRASADLLDRVGFNRTDKIKLSGDADEPLEIVISRPLNVPTPPEASTS